jgi:hypothetical protein
MSDAQERQLLLHGEDAERTRKPSVVSFNGSDLDNPKEWSTKYRWFSVVLLCGFAAVVYAIPTFIRSMAS